MKNTKEEEDFGEAHGCCGCEVLVIPHYIEEHPNGHPCLGCPHIKPRK